jgi:hypothetical protein
VAAGKFACCPATALRPNAPAMAALTALNNKVRRDMRSPRHSLFGYKSITHPHKSSIDDLF